MSTTPLLPGATIGILGGGHMGRMTAIAARELGFRVHVLESDPACTAHGIADRSVDATLADASAVREVVRGCDVITTSVEQVPVASLEIAARTAPLRPGLDVVAIAQDRARERQWLERRGVCVGPWRAADSRDDVARAVRELGGPCYVKPRVRRADDMGPMLLATPAEATTAWVALRGRPSVVERVLPVSHELSVLVARSPDGATAAYPAALSGRDHAALLWSVLPGPVPAQLARKAETLACYLAARLRLEGLLTVELFLLRDGRLAVNELVPCPHGTFHATEIAGVTSQFEQLVRAVAGLPLGATEAVRPSATTVVAGDLWHGGRTPLFDDALRVPGVRLQLYGTPRPAIGRPMGHLSASGPTPEDALGTVLRAAAQLPPDRTRRSVARRRLRPRPRRPA